MDKVSLTFDMPNSYNAKQVGQQTINIITPEYEKARFTCALSVTAPDEKLLPIIIFKRKTLSRERFLSGMNG